MLACLSFPRRRMHTEAHALEFPGASVGLSCMCVTGFSTRVCSGPIPHPHPCTFEGALQLLAPAVQVAAGTEEAADGGGDHRHEEDHSRGDACYGLGT